MVIENVTYENLSKSNYVGKDELFIEHFSKNTYSIYQQRDKSGEEWHEYFRCVNEVTVPDTNYKKNMVDWTNQIMDYFDNHKEECFVIIDFTFEKYYSYELIVNKKTKKIVSAFRGYDSLKVPLEEHYKYWGSQ